MGGGGFGGVGDGRIGGSAVGGDGSSDPSSASNGVPPGYIRYQGQLMTIQQYQQALSSPSASLTRRELHSSDHDTLFHKRQAPSLSGDQTDGQAPPAKKVAKVLMCINGDPAVPPVKFNTMTGLRIRDPTAQQDGVVEVTNLPNYQMPWMPFLPTEEMWAEQQTLMLAQEDMIQHNTTTAPPPAAA